jgi:hypothetical protein
VIDPWIAIELKPPRLSPTLHLLRTKGTLPLSAAVQVFGRWPSRRLDSLSCRRPKTCTLHITGKSRRGLWDYLVGTQYERVGTSRPSAFAVEGKVESHCQHGKKNVVFLFPINALNATTSARERCFESEQRGVQ